MVATCSFGRLAIEVNTVIQSSRLYPAVVTRFSAWHCEHVDCTSSLPAPSGNWTGGCWPRWASVAADHVKKTKTAVAKPKSNFLNIVPPFAANNTRPLVSLQLSLASQHSRPLDTLDTNNDSEGRSTWRGYDGGTDCWACGECWPDGLAAGRLARTGAGRIESTREEFAGSAVYSRQDPSD